MDWRGGLASGARDILDRDLSGAELARFASYLDLLSRWQRVQRLVGATEPGWVVEHVFLDSLLFLKVLPRTAVTVLDFGSGAGIPGIPMKIARPELRVTLLDARQKRASFLRAVVRALDLPDTRVIASRAEELLETTPERFDAVVMRCAGDPARALPLAVRLVLPGGVVIASSSRAARPPAHVQLVRVGVKDRSPRSFLVYGPSGASADDPSRAPRAT